MKLNEVFRQIVSILDSIRYFTEEEINNSFKAFKADLLAGFPDAYIKTLEEEKICFSDAEVLEKIDNLIEYLKEYRKD